MAESGDIEGFNPEIQVDIDKQFLIDAAKNPRVADYINKTTELLKTEIADPEILARFISQLTKEMLKFAMIDGLTGLMNQEGFKGQLGEELARAQRLGYPVSLLFIDLDGFKALNDGKGHPAGDAALAEIANQLRASTRENDQAGRVGGDEFAVALPGVGIGALSVARRILTRVPQAVPGLTTSIGIAISGPNETPGTLYARADAGTLWSKANGKNQISVMNLPGQNIEIPESFKQAISISANTGPPPPRIGR